MNTDKAMIKILSELVNCDYAELVEIFGQGCNYPTGRGVEGFEVQFDVEAMNNLGKTRCYTVVYQSKERTDNMRAYNGYEMATAAQYGCSADESVSLVHFIDFQIEALQELKERAEDLCKEWLENALRIEALPLRVRMLINNGYDWYVVTLEDGSYELMHKSALSSILQCGANPAEFGFENIEQCWNGEDLSDDNDL